MHRLSEKQTGKKSLKFHTRALGNSLGCLPVDVSFIIDLGTLLHRVSVKNDLWFLSPAMSYQILFRLRWVEQD